ncbi:MAG: hypothetical protein WC050_02305 [Candidatus Paceibacterota bacterium]
MELLTPDVLKNTFSASDLYRRADILQRFFEHFFFELSSHTGERCDLIRAYYRDSDGETLGHAVAVAAWGAGVLDQFTAENLYERIREFKHAVQSLPKLTLYVPVHFPAAQIERIGRWCRTEIQPDVILDLRIDSGTVGGCAFAYHNAFHDVSFTYFSNKERKTLVDLVHSYDG